MKYLDIEKRIQNQINGIIAQFIDAYIRQNKVWTPLQMFDSFYEKLQKEIDYWTEEQKEFSEMKWFNENSVIWLISTEGKHLSLERFEKKYKKDKKVADRKSPLVERIRFGFKSDESKFFDINFGLHKGYSFIPTQDFEKIKFNPWSIIHVENELSKKYNTDLSSCLSMLSTSHLEKLFVDYWLEKYFPNKNNSAIIPEVCGFRQLFYYYEFDNSVYGNRNEIPSELVSNFKRIKNVNFRYDFLIVNFEKQKIAFVELDGFEYHKSRNNQTIDSIKRNKASTFKTSLLTFTSKRILENIEAVFNDLEEYLK